VGLDKNEFEDAASFSIWEALEGINRVVVADSAIPNRYHITAIYHRKEDSLLNYAIFENGRLEREFIIPLPENLKADLGNLVKLYENVRNLGRFDPNHCPIMEFQTYNGKNYFLQYHRARDFSQSEFTLDRTLQDGEIEVPFVRGATSKNGMNCKVTLYYAGERLVNFNPDGEDGSYDLNSGTFFTELQVKKRKVQIIDSDELEYSLAKIVGEHIQRSKLFKPQVSIIHDTKDVMNEEEVSDHYKRVRQTGENSYLDLHIVSDGRRAFIRRL